MAGEDELDRRLKAADPLSSGVVHTEASRAALDAIRLWARSGALEPEERGGRRLSLARRGTRRGVAIASAVGVLIVGGGATAAILSSTTVGAPGFCQTVLNETADISFPSGYQAWQNWALLQSVGPPLGATLHGLCDTPAGAHMADDAYPGRFVIPPISEKVQFVMAAFCAWTDDWLNAEANGDTATATQAANEIAGAYGWPATQAIQAPGSHVGPDQLAWFSPVQQAVQTGDLSAVRAAFVYYPKGKIPDSECYALKPPANSNNGTVYVAPSA